MTWSVSYGLIYTVRIPICVQNSDRHAGPASKHGPDFEVSANQASSVTEAFSLFCFDAFKGVEYPTFLFSWGAVFCFFFIVYAFVIIIGKCKLLQCNRWMDGWMSCDFTPL